MKTSLLCLGGFGLVWFFFPFVVSEEAEGLVG